MHRVLCLAIVATFFLPLSVTAQITDHDRIAGWLQDAAWDEVISLANSNSAPDNYLLQSAGYAAYQLGDKTSAASYYNKLLLVDSINKQALYYSALIYKSDEQCSLAIPLLERLCAAAPTIAQYRVVLAECYTATNDGPAAIRALQTAARLSPASPVIANKLAAAWISVKGYDSAAPLLKAALQQHPADPALLSTAISLAYNLKQYRRVSALCDSLIICSPGKLRYDALLTGLYADISQPDYNHAVTIGEMLMALGRDGEEVLYYTALAHQHLGHWRMADTMLRRCVRRMLKPNLEGYYLALAEGAAHQKQWTQAKAYCDTAYYLFRNPAVLYRSGRLLEEGGKKRDALALYKRYLSLPGDRQDTAVARYMRTATAP